MITVMNERLAQFMKLEGLTAVKFAEIMEVQPSSISHLLSGRNKPNFDFISRILLRFPQLNPDWIINGIGEVYKSKSAIPNDVVTDVIHKEITDVIQSSETENPKIHSKETLSELIKHSVNNGDKEVDSVFTDVNSHSDIQQDFYPSVESEHPASSEILAQVSGKKVIERIVLFFSDGTFTDYQK